VRRRLIQLRSSYPGIAAYCESIPILLRDRFSMVARLKFARHEESDDAIVFDQWTNRELGLMTSVTVLLIIS